MSTEPSLTLAEFQAMSSDQQRDLSASDWGAMITAAMVEGLNEATMALPDYGPPEPREPQLSLFP